METRYILRRKKSMSLEQEAFVRKHHEAIPVVEMSKMLKVTKTVVYSYLRVRGLSFIKTQPGTRGQAAGPVKEGFFDVDARDLWI